MKSNTWFDFLTITLASPEQIKGWGTHNINNNIIFGEIKTTELTLPDLLTPVQNGLFCEKIFGSIDINRCNCGNTFFTLYNSFCKFCNTTKCFNLKRRYRMGYITLYRPIVHRWYMSPSCTFISLLLDLENENLIEMIYFSTYKFFNLYHNPYMSRSLKIFDKTFYQPLIGTLFVQFLLKSLNLKIELLRCRMILYLSIIGYSNHITKRRTRRMLLNKIRLLENFISTNSHPSWMIIENLPVLPPILRPLLKDSNGLLVSDINKLYLDIIQDNLFLEDVLNDRKSSRLVISNSYRLLQESVDRLIDSRRQYLDQIKAHKSSINSLSMRLRGKYGRFRFNLLGKRIDASGRAIITVNPFLKLNQCGLPFKIAIKLFELFLIRDLLRLKIVDDIREAKFFLEKSPGIVWLLMVKLMRQYLIILNRAPTLHRLGLQAFQPILILGNSIQLPPLVCSAFNADFDGDQMSVSLPFTKNSQCEVRKLVYTPQNLLSVTTGEPVLIPSHEMIIGSNFLTLNEPYKDAHFPYYTSFTDVLVDFTHQRINLQSIIYIRLSLYHLSSIISLRHQLFFKNLDSKFFLTTVGRLFKYKTISKILYT